MPSPRANVLNRGEKAYVLSSPGDKRPRAKVRPAARGNSQGTVWMVGLLLSVCSALVLMLISALQE